MSSAQAQVMGAIYGPWVVNSVNPISGSGVFRRVPRTAVYTCGKLHGQGLVVHPRTFDKKDTPTRVCRDA